MNLIVVAEMKNIMLYPVLSLISMSMPFTYNLMRSLRVYLCVHMTSFYSLYRLKVFYLFRCIINFEMPIKMTLV